MDKNTKHRGKLKPGTTFIYTRQNTSISDYKIRSMAIFNQFLLEKQIQFARKKIHKKGSCSLVF